jgi:hypothetical protein
MNFLKTLFLVFLTFILNTFSFGQALEFKKYSFDNDSSKIHFSFDIPSTWTISPDNDRNGFLGVCRPTKKEELKTYNYCWEGIIFHLQFFSSDLDSTLKSEGNYTKVGDTYITSDRVNDSVMTKSLKGSNWTGLYHNNTCGITCTENGFHAAAGECEFIYFSNGKQTICISTNGKSFHEKVLLKIIETFKFNN